MLRLAFKRCIQGVSIVLVAPLALLAGGGRWRSLFDFGVQALAIVPGAPGIYLRAAFYWMTLRRSDLDVSIHFGVIISNPEAEIAKSVSIGAYSLIGKATIGEGTQIAGHVQIVSGKQQHQRDASGNLTDAGRVFQEVRIGSHCWIGAGAIITTDVGDQATVGAGSVVVKSVPAGATAVGNPARVLESKLAPVSEPPTA